MRKYSSTVPEMAIATQNLEVGDTTIYLNNNTWPVVTAGNTLTLVIDPDTDNEEIVYVTQHDNLAYTATIIRARESTTAKQHIVGKKVRHMITAADIQEAHDHMANGRPDLNTGQTPVHSLTGSVVGTSDSQTLTNKIISGTLNQITNVSAANVTGLSGVYAPLASPNFTGTPQISGAAIATQAYADGKVAEPNSNGFVVRTGDNASAARSIAVSGTGLSITNADGVAGNPTITFTSSGSVSSVTGTANQITSVTNLGAVTLSFPTTGVTLPTGSLVATTPAAGDNTTKVATTAFVTTAVAGAAAGTTVQSGSVSVSYSSGTGTATVTTADTVSTSIVVATASDSNMNVAVTSVGTDTFTLAVKTIDGATSGGSVTVRWMVIK